MVKHWDVSIKRVTDDDKEVSSAFRFYGTAEDARVELPKLFLKLLQDNLNNK